MRNTAVLPVPVTIEQSGKKESRMRISEEAKPVLEVFVNTIVLNLRLHEYPL